MNVLITDKPFEPEATLSQFRQRVRETGAIVTFTGLVRGEDQVSALELSHYSGFTENEIMRIGRDATNRWQLSDWSVVHRVGRIQVGHPIIFVATAAKHRRAAFEATEYLMDFLKSEAPFWKQKWRSHDKRWIEPSEQDIANKIRWEN
jgi:molybdopterin synthase catalytic subunit